MKVKNIQLQNFANYDKVDVSFDENITYLIGKNGSGKSTIGITAMWFMFQGIAEKATGGNNPLIGERFRFIGPNAATAKGEMLLHDEKKGIDIKVMRKLTKSGTELKFEAPEGYDINQQWLTDLFNIFLIAPKKFTELSPKQQAIALGIDTESFDKDIADLKQEHLMINRELKQYDNLQVVEKAEKVSVQELQNKKEEIREKLNKQYQDNKAHNQTLKAQWTTQCDKIDSEVEEFNEGQSDLLVKYNACFDSLSILRNNGYEGEEVCKFLDSLKSFMEPNKRPSDLYPPKPEYIDELPNSKELDDVDAQILNATSNNEKALLYEQYLQKKVARSLKEKELADNKEKQNKKAEERLEYIKKFKFPFSNLSVDEDGGLLLNAKPIKEPYFSTGELLKLIPILISSQNPELKYVFLQDFNLLDDDKRAEIEKYLVDDNGFQLVVELVGKEKVVDKNCILLRDSKVVDSYDDKETETITV